MFGLRVFSFYEHIDVAVWAQCVAHITPTSTQVLMENEADGQSAMEPTKLPQQRAQGEIQSATVFVSRWRCCETGRDSSVDGLCYPKCVSDAFSSLRPYQITTHTFIVYCFTLCLNLYWLFLLVVLFVDALCLLSCF
jgi:hypothetical protein